MAKQSVKVMVACGSGVATSTIAKEAVERIAGSAGVPIQIVKCTLGEVPARQAEVDLVLTTANYRKPLDKPHMSVFGLVSGVNAAKVESDLAALLQKIAAED